MKRHKHLYEQVCSFENLHGAAYTALRGKRGKKPAAAFFANLEEELVALHSELVDETYQHGDYHYFKIHEPKERRVAAAPFRDRVVYHAIVRVVEPLFECRYIEDSYACRKGKGSHAGMRRAAQFTRKYPYALKCDIRKYFANIDHEILSNQLARVIGDPRLLDLMNHILASHSEGHRMVWGEDLFSVRRIGRGLPIGNLTSQFWANVYLNALDHFVKHELRCKGYVRYIDDTFCYSATTRRNSRRGEPRCGNGCHASLAAWIGHAGHTQKLWTLPRGIKRGGRADGIKRRRCWLGCSAAVPLGGAANKKAPPAASSVSERGGRCCVLSE